MKGELFVLSSPAGGGKTTIANSLIKEIPNLKRVVTCTTRKPRPNEKNGVDYFFLSKDEFEERIKKGDFLEYAVVHGNYYGTPRKEVEEELSKGYDLILVIDVQGMRQIKKNKQDVITVFILPPSIEELVRRMKKRGDSEEEIKKRLETAKKEIPAWKEYDFVVINDILEEAKEKIKQIILVQRLKSSRFNPDVIKDRELRELMGL
ncbi:guanylate kinase [Persephonella hydrogeniphila]|uniref:Guanylate kinase n=1 Tax=Persephonella hydrogeniphila TaxID=198703 RepID=A0A285NLA0_9AQUI|nr:guanylate kinase [Persephonella hydrogeniphila]SNZ10272.1 guanylate kinase [Persephonella hydrogeniphila]